MAGHYPAVALRRTMERKDLALSIASRLQRGRFAVLAVSAALATAACGGSGEDLDATIEVVDAVSLPAASGDGSVLVYRAVRDGLLSSVGVDAVSGDELWAVVDSSFDPSLGRPTVLGDVLYAVDFDDEALEATIRAIDTASGEEVWSSPLGPHYAGPYECGDDIVCLHAHPEAEPVSTWRFTKDSGDPSEGRAGGRTIYADEDASLTEITPGVTLGLSRDADSTMEWTAPIVDVFGPGHGTEGGYWVERSGNWFAVWLGEADVLDGTFVIFDIDQPDPVATFSGVPCLAEAAEVDLICTRDGEEMRLVDWDGTVIDSVSVPLPEGEVVPDHLYDETGRLVLLGEEVYRLDPEGFISASAPETAWCPTGDPDPVTETSRSRPVEVEVGRHYYPCSPSDGEPLDSRSAALLVQQSTGSPNAETLLTFTKDIVAFHPGPSTELTIARR